MGVFKDGARVIYFLNPHVIIVYIDAYIFFRDLACYITTPSIWQYEGTEAAQQFENALECVPRKVSRQATGSSSIDPPCRNTQIYFSPFSYYLYVTLEQLLKISFGGYIQL